MNMRYAYYILVVSIILSFAVTANQYNDWAQKNAININEAAAAAQNPSSPMFQRIKQESQTCKMVEVVFLQRPLEADQYINGLAQKRYGKALAHVQVVAIDKTTHHVIDNFGFSMTDLAKVLSGQTAPGMIVKEKINDDFTPYESKPLGRAEMSLECYERAKSATINQLNGAHYSPVNDVDWNLKSDAAKGALNGCLIGGAKGAIEGGVKGAVASGISGALTGVMVGAGKGCIVEGGDEAVKEMDRGLKDAISKYEPSHYRVVSNDARQMSVPGFNCQVVPDLFIKNAKGDPTLKVVENYHHPGESIKEAETSIESSVASIDISKLEDLLKEQIVFVKALLAKGERATNGEIATYNARAGRILEELKRIVNQINSLSVSEEEKTRIAQDKVVKVKELSEQLAKLVDEVLKKKLIDHLAPTPFANSAETSAPGSHNGGNDDTAGVRGWCHCKHSDKHVVGTPPVAPYTYSICLTCGKVEKAEEGYKGLMVIDNRYYKGADRGKADAEQAKLFEIPDGQVVIPGKCACPKPDPITAGPTRVCITCGLACIP